ncbi:MAG: BMP family ABC transporter substrate-binding protein [Candidatus Limnocylindria bacterium]
MRIRTTGLALFAAASVIVAACGGGGESVAPSVAPTDAPSVAPSVAPTDAPTAAPGADLKIGVVTDVGTVNDKNFNEYTYVGAQQGAAAIGAAEPPVVVPTSDADYGPLIQAFIDQDFDIIVSTGFNLEGVTAAAAKANSDIWFIGVDHAPCINAAGDVDPTFADCSGDIATLLPNYIAINYAEDQAGYLAGIVAASATKSNIIGAIGGVSLCGPCIRYIQGYDLGAKSVNPDITVKAAWVSDSDFRLGFADQAAGKNFAQQFIQQNAGVDVLFQVAGLTGNGVIDAACEAGINAIGVDVDQHESYPASQACILTSAEKKLSNSVSQSIIAIADGSAAGGRTTFDAANDGIGVSPFYDAASKLAADTQSKVDAALAAMKAGTLVTCPEDCGSQDALPLGD